MMMMMMMMMRNSMPLSMERVEVSKRMSVLTTAHSMETHCGTGPRGAYQVMSIAADTLSMWVLVKNKKVVSWEAKLQLSRKSAREHPVHIEHA